MEKLKKKVTIVLMAIMMTMVFFADAQAKAGCNHKHTGSLVIQFNLLVVQSGAFWADVQQGL